MLTGDSQAPSPPRSFHASLEAGGLSLENRAQEDLLY